MPTSDERGDDEEHQPGDLVIEIHRGVPVIYTEPDGGGSVRKAGTANQDKPARSATNRANKGRANTS